MHMHMFGPSPWNQSNNYCRVESGGYLSWVLCQVSVCDCPRPCPSYRVGTDSFVFPIPSSLKAGNLQKIRNRVHRSTSASSSWEKPKVTALLPVKGGHFRVPPGGGAGGGIIPNSFSYRSSFCEGSMTLELDIVALCWIVWGNWVETDWEKLYSSTFHKRLTKQSFHIMLYNKYKFTCFT